MRNMKPSLSLLFATVLTVLCLQSVARPQSSTYDDVVWHWFAHHRVKDTLQLTIYFMGKPIYDTSFSIFRKRRGDIGPEHPQRILKFFFNAPLEIFGRKYRSLGSGIIEGNIWQAGRDPGWMLLGVSFVNGRRVFLNSLHTAKPYKLSRSDLARGLFITTHPLNGKHNESGRGK